MPRILKTIDEIACIKNRDVLLLDFIDMDDLRFRFEEGSLAPDLQRRICELQDYLQNEKIEWDYSWETNPIRQKIIDLLDNHQIPWMDAYPPFSLDYLVYPYSGSIYLDVPYDEQDPVYQKCLELLENSDGSMKWPGVSWWAFRLDKMQKLWEERQAQMDDF